MPASGTKSPVVLHLPCPWPSFGLDESVFFFFASSRSTHPSRSRPAPPLDMPYCRFSACHGQRESVGEKAIWKRKTSFDAVVVPLDLCQWRAMESTRLLFPRRSWLERVPNGCRRGSVLQRLLLARLAVAPMRTAASTCWSRGNPRERGREEGIRKRCRCARAMPQQCGEEDGLFIPRQRVIIREYVCS